MHRKCTIAQVRQCKVKKFRGNPGLPFQRGVQGEVGWVSKMLSFERAISVSYLVPTVRRWQKQYFYPFSRNSFCYRRNDRQTTLLWGKRLDDERIRACICCKTLVPKREQRALLDESCNIKPVLRSQIMVCVGVHLVPVWAQFFIFVISNISAKQTSHLCLYKLD